MNDQRFSQLLEVWNHHQDLRVSGASIAELSASRVELDRARGRLR